MALLQSLTLLLIAVITFFVPGYIWSFVFFPNKSKSSDSSQKAVVSVTGITERIILSVGLSVLLVSLSGFLASALLSFPVSELGSGIVVLLVCLLGLLLIEITSPGVILGCYQRVSSVLRKLVKSPRK